MTKPGIIPLIGPEEPLRSALEKIVRARTRELLSFKNTAKKASPDAVHDMRVACRRLLSILKIFKGAAGVNSARARKLKRIFRSLQDVRECDVFLNLTGKFTEKYGAKGAAARLTGEYSKKRKLAAAKLKKALNSFELGRP